MYVLIPELSSVACTCMVVFLSLIFPALTARQYSVRYNLYRALYLFNIIMHV